MVTTAGGWDLNDALEAVEAAPPVDAVDAVTGMLAAVPGIGGVSFLVVDFAGRAMVRLGGGAAVLGSDGADRSAHGLPLADSLVGRVLAGQRPQTIETPQGWGMLAPVSQRGEVVGLLEILFDTAPDAAAEQAVQRAAHLLAFVVIANGRHTDLFEGGRRSTRFELSAEIQRRLLPDALTCEAGEVTLSAWLEPAATIGGDTFDYSVESDVVHLSVTDAMGHGVSSALTATLCVGSLRNSRRAGVSLPEQADLADRAMHDHAPRSFVTGMLGRIDLQTGVLSLVNAGHVPPLLMRGDRVTPIELPVDLPFGLNGSRGYRQTDVPLEAGDRLVVVTDGMLERNAASLPITGLLEQTRALHPREATRQLADAVLEVAGPDLADDATILVVDWHGADRRRRDSSAGADVR